jgi:lysophospholipase
VDDLGLLVDRARTERPGLPLFLLGHSMGGLIAARYVLRHQDRLSGLILSGPALLIGEDMPAWAKRVLLGVSRVAPWVPIPRGKPGVLSRNPEVERAFASDALCHNGRTRLGYVRALYLASEETRPRGGELRVPLLVMHGDADTLTSCRGSREFVERAASIDKTLKLWPESRHEIFNDLDADAVLAYMLDWLAARVTSPT